MEKEDDDEEEEQEEEEEVEEGGKFGGYDANNYQCVPTKWKKKSQLQGPGWSSLPGHVQKRTAKAAGPKFNSPNRNHEILPRVYYVQLSLE